MAAAAAQAGGSIIGGIIGSKGAKKAAKAQAKAAQAGIDETKREFDVTQGNFAPYLKAGTAALGSEGDLVGINGAPAQQTAIDQLKASPFYQSLFNNGQETLLQNAAATGGLRGGNTEGALADFGRDTLAQTIQQQIGNFGGIAGQGAASTGQLGSLSANNAAAIAAGLNQKGAAQAGGILGSTAAIAGGINGAFSSLAGLGGGGGLNTGAINAQTLGNLNSYIAANPAPKF